MIIVKRSEKFSILYNLPPGTHTIILMGGRGGMKTYEASKFIAVSATTKRKRCVILRDEKERIRQTILNEIWQRYNTANKFGQLDKFYTKNDTELKDKTGDVLIYTQGFRASDNTKTANLKGPSDIDIAVFEEAEDIRDVEKFNTFADGLRKEGCLKVILLNTPDIGHWISKRYFITEHVADGYYDLIPKEIPGVVVIKTNYKDNPYLPAHTVSDYEGYGDPTHHLYNYHYYMTAILGYASTGRKGQILTKVKPISLKEYLALPYTEVYGQDFGTASPAALIGAKFYQNTCWAREINYKPMDILSLGKLYCSLKFDARDRIVCDYAEPDSIEKLSGGFKNLTPEEYKKYPGLGRGFFAVACPTKDISAGITLMTGMNLFMTEDSTNAWEEINNYIYAQDKYKNYTDEPIDDYNHCFVAGTLVDTIAGKKKIVDVQAGDFVLTSNGYKKVLVKHDNGMKQTFNYCLQFDTFCVNLRCTKNHLIKTTEGWVIIDELKPNHRIYLNNTSMGSSTPYMQERDIFQEEQGECILSFGSTQMACAFQRGSMFTILMKIHSITNLVIWNLRQRISTFQNILKEDILKIKNGLKTFIQKVSKQQKNGINHRMELNGINSTPLVITSDTVTTAQVYAKIAIRNSKNNKDSNNSAQIHANHLTDENLELIMNSENAKNAVIHSRLISIQKQGAAQKNVQQVYDLSVDETHEYFANGILVHNCLDAWRYVIDDQRGKKRLFGI